MKPPKTSWWILVLALAFSLGIAVLDYLSRLNPVPWHGLFVVPVIWIALWSAEDDLFLLPSIAAIETGLSLLPVLWSIGNTYQVPLAERAIAVVTIWLTVLIALLRKRAQRTYKWINLTGKR